jgi:hypothetical protein
LIIVFAVNYPAGLALYWVVTTLCSIVLQYFVTGWGALFSSPLHVPEALPQTDAAAGPHHSTAPVSQGSETGMRDAPVTTAGKPASSHCLLIYPCDARCMGTTGRLRRGPHRCNH